MRLNEMEKRVIEDTTSKILMENSYFNQEIPCVDIVEIAKENGFVVGLAHLDNLDDGYISIHESQNRFSPQKKIIGINENRSLPYKRFIIAHELGHYHLHYKPNEHFLLHRENRRGKNCEENDADFFAATLLMPKKKFVEIYEKMKENGVTEDQQILELANIFSVPIDSVERRIEEIYSV